MSMVQQQHRFLGMVCKLYAFASSRGFLVTGGELWRTPEMAKIYSSQGKGIQDSEHCLRLAIDLNFFLDGKLVQGRNDLQEIGLFWESLGGTWGGRFKKYDDSGHFQLRG